MADVSDVPARSWWARLRGPWVVAAAVLLLCCGGGCVVFQKAVEYMDPNPRHMTAEQAAAFEARYLDKETLEQEGRNLEALLARTGDEVAALVPGLTWKWIDEWGYPGCPGDPAGDTRVNRVWVRNVVFDGPIPAGAWPEAVAVVRRAAASYGATEF